LKSDACEFLSGLSILAKKEEILLAIHYEEKNMNRKHIFLKTITGALALLLTSVISITPSVAQDAMGMLDNKVFVGTTGEKGKEASKKDEIRFGNGHFRSAGCDEWGFEQAPYKVKTEGDSIRFHAVATSPTHGKMEWDGVVQGDTVEAKYVWTKERWYWKDAHQEKWFKGTLN